MLAGLLLSAASLVQAEDRAKDNAAASSEGAKPTKTVRLLNVGNSFSGNATRCLNDLVKAAGHKLVHRSASIGGSSMEVHWVKVEQHEKDPEDARGLYASKKGLKEELQLEPWDFVTIQQASIRSHDVATYRPYARQLSDYIHKYAPGAKLLIHQTWAYRSDDPRFKVTAPKPGEPATQAAMYQGLSSAYKTIAAELGVDRIPVGDAFYLADTDPKWGYRADAMFDAKTAQSPALPDQTHSLHVGWRWMKQKDGKLTLAIDGHHANVAGEYLGACVFFETLFGESCVGNKFVSKGIDPAYARFLQETAHKAVTAARASASER
jgi:hypothetical protein